MKLNQIQLEKTYGIKGSLVFLYFFYFAFFSFFSPFFLSIIVKAKKVTLR